MAVEPAGAEAPFVLLSCAVTLDGYLNDSGPERLELSTPDDRDAVDALRAASDAILVGAGTIRADDPSLLVRSPVRRAGRRLAGRSASPMRVVLTRSGVLDSASLVLSDGLADTLVYIVQPRDAGVRLPAIVESSETSSGHVKRVFTGRSELKALLRDLWKRGAHRVLIEGGEKLTTHILTNGLADLVRVAIRPLVIGRSSAPRLAGKLRVRNALMLELQLVHATSVGGMAVLWYSRGSVGDLRAFAPRTDCEWLAEAIELAGRCPRSDGAYSVGAIIVDRSGNRLSDGYSRELDPKVHAEEAAIRKARHLDLSGACMYTSMEPCSRRLSGRTPCVEHIRSAGIARVVYAMREPTTFVQCDGTQQLRVAGVETIQIGELEPYAAAPNQHLVARHQSGA